MRTGDRQQVPHHQPPLAHAVRFLTLLVCAPVSASLTERYTSLAAELSSLQIRRAEQSTELAAARDLQVSHRGDLSTLQGRERALVASKDQLETERGVKHDEYLSKQTEQVNNRQCMQVHLNERSKLQAELAQAERHARQLDAERSQVSTAQKKAIDVFEELQGPLNKGRQIAKQHANDLTRSQLHASAAIRQ